MGVGQGGRQVVQVLHLGAALPGTASAKEGAGGFGDFWSIPQTPLWHKQGSPLLTLAWALPPTTTVLPKKLALALCRLAPAPPYAPLHGTRPILRVTDSLQPLRPARETNSPSLGDLGNCSGLSNTSFRCLTHYCRTLACSSAYICVLPGLPGSSSHCRHAGLGATKILPSCQKRCEVWGGDGIRDCLAWLERTPVTPPLPPPPAFVISIKLLFCDCCQCGWPCSRRPRGLGREGRQGNVL